MIISISKQLGLLFFSLLSGLIIGSFFDIYRIIRGNQNLKKFIKIIEDILFWVLSAIVVFIFLLYNDCAFIGMYIYLWIFVALYLYLILLSRYNIKILKHIMFFLGKFFRILKNIILYPFKFIIYKLK
ncbi:spore cortex biosynthesis protein YabQ [Clostridium oceanicum]|uniref:Spore cortex biosynthesis protein YabQ n=1 Tax=Clostridium oceanicum TaxID=1543 RepID=A0ABP3UZ06_9CLOT